jgi:hypothetical protein
MALLGYTAPLRPEAPAITGAGSGSQTVGTDDQEAKKGIL